jgi:hypothetical protein
MGFVGLLRLSPFVKSIPDGKEVVLFSGFNIFKPRLRIGLRQKKRAQ